jgi:hypothetical protein
MVGVVMTVVPTQFVMGLLQVVVHRVQRFHERDVTGFAIVVVVVLVVVQVVTGLLKRRLNAQVQRV